MKITVKIIRLEHFQGDLPKYQTEGASGFDVCAAIKEPMVLAPLARTLVPTGMTVEIPLGYEIQVRPRSGLAIKQGLTVLNTPGTIDSDYRGEVKVIVINLSDAAVTVNPGDRIAQMVLAPVMRADLCEVQSTSETMRGVGGFGSTGIGSTSPKPLDL